MTTGAITLWHLNPALCRSSIIFSLRRLKSSPISTNSTFGQRPTCLSVWRNSLCTGTMSTTAVTCCQAAAMCWAKTANVCLGPGDKLVIPAGAIHAEGEVTERMVYIVGLPVAANLFETLTLLDPADSPTRKGRVVSKA